MVETKTTACVLFCLLVNYVTLSLPYLLLVNDDQKPGAVIFNASVYKLGSERHYKINGDRSAPFVHRLIHVDPKEGQVSLKENVDCDSPYYPNLFTVYVDSTSSRLKSIDYYSLPLRIVIVGKRCSADESNRGLENQHGNGNHREVFRDGLSTRSHVSINIKIQEVKNWISETYASFAIPTADKWNKICLKKSQLVNSISAFLPMTISTYCDVGYLEISDDRFTIEVSQGDLVASRDTCIAEPMWKVAITFHTQCKGVNILDTEHRLKIVYHHQEFNDSDIEKRVRRELRNQSPFFEQHLYIASVLEECDPGVVVTTVKAR